MIKFLAALAIFAFSGVAVVALPGFAPEVKANEVVALVKADRLAIRQIDSNCASQNWPNIASPCLRQAGSDAFVREARLVTAHREP